MVKTLSILAVLFPALALAQGDGVIAFGTKLMPKTHIAQSREFAKSVAKPGSPGWQARGDQRRTYRFPGTETDLPYRVYVPTTWDGKAKLPLVLMLHGGGSNESQYLDQNNKQLLKLAEDHGYLLVSPLGSSPLGAGAKDIRIAMDFEAPNGSAAEWLNTGKYVARRILDEPAKALTLRVHDVSNVAVKTDAANVIRIAKPDGVPPQPWSFRQKDAAEKPGKELIVESVGLSPSQRAGASKRGNRDIISITGGDLSGRITGKVLAGGADYQNLSGPPAIDAHYLWQASDGEIIIVRNTISALGGLVPSFETRVDGPYAYLNTGKFLSSNPGMANGGVKITMYDSTN